MSWGGASQQALDNLQSQINALNADLGNGEVAVPPASSYASPAYNGVTMSAIDHSLDVTRTTAQFGSGFVQALYAGANIYCGIASPEGGMLIESVTIGLLKSGSPTGTMVAELHKGSDGSLVATSSTSLDVSTLTTGVTNQTFNFPLNSVAPPGSVYIVVHFQSTSSNASNYVGVSSYNTGQNEQDYFVVSTDGVNFTGSIQETVVASYTYNPSANYQAVDGNTGTFAQIPSGVNPYFIFDAGSVQLIAGCRIYWPTNGRPSTYNIDVSEDGSNWTNVFTVTNQQPPNGAYKVYKWNLTACRYIRVQPQQTTQLDIAEFGYYALDTVHAIAQHGHGAPF